jgi:hypothetical protein
VALLDKDDVTEKVLLSEADNDGENDALLEPVVVTVVEKLEDITLDTDATPVDVDVAVPVLLAERDFDIDTDGVILMDAL